MAKFAFIGIGSVMFGAGTIADLLYFKDKLPDTTLSLVDINPETLEFMLKLADKMNKEAGSPFKVEASVNRRDVIEGADFIIIAAAIKREELWKKDWDIVHNAGIKQTYGENGGPGSLSLTLRNVPMILDICRDVEELAPDAIVINFTNPESIICMAIDRYTNLKFVGLCHQIMAGYRIVGRVLDIPTDDLDIKAAGLNHFTWMYSIHQKSTGKDLYPIFKQKIERNPIKEEPLSCIMFKTCGMFPTPGDHHLAEMLSFGWQFQGLKGRDFDYWHKLKANSLAWVKGVVNGSRRIEEMVNGLSGERIVHMAMAIINNMNSYEISMNVRNQGAISNLPDNAIVETPGIISSMGITPLCMPPIPESIAGFLRKQIKVQELSVEAAITGDRRIALQAMMLDPVVDDFIVAEKVLDQLIESNREYISPNFFK